MYFDNINNISSKITAQIIKDLISDKAYYFDMDGYFSVAEKYRWLTPEQIVKNLKWE